MNREELQTFLQTLLAWFGVDGQRVRLSEGQRIVVQLSLGEDGKLLIGPNGETLSSLNHLAKRLAEKRFGSEALHFTIDVDGYLEAKLEEVRASARLLAQRARLFKHEVEMPAMSAYQRLVVHELFAEDPEIQTESKGEGKFRHIILKYSPRS